MKPVIDKEIHGLIPALSDEEYEQLKANIKRDGCRNALSIWKGKNILLDGHNRLKICEELKTDYKTEDINLDTRDEAIEWVIRNQLGRRNITQFVRYDLIKHLRPIIEAKAKKRQEGGVPVNLPEGKGDTREELAKLAQVSGKQLDRMTYIDEHADENTKNALRKNEETVNAVYTTLKREEKQKKQALMPKPTLPEGKYNVILADPPWKYDFSETQSRKIEDKYPTLELSEIKALAVPSADDAVLLLWATAPKLREALEVMSAWGFEYKTNAVWDKMKIGMGYWFRGQHELLLLGVKGDVSPPAEALRRSSVITEERTEHSKKPEVIYEMIEQMFPDAKYLELFARKDRPKWVSWGNELA